jgi:hypothetical protein
MSEKQVPISFAMTALSGFTEVCGCIQTTIMDTIQNALKVALLRLYSRSREKKYFIYSIYN